MLFVMDLTGDVVIVISLLRSPFPRFWSVSNRGIASALASAFGVRPDPSAVADGTRVRRRPISVLSASIYAMAGTRANHSDRDQLGNLFSQGTTRSSSG